MKKYTEPTPKDLADIALLEKALPPVHLVNEGGDLSAAMRTLQGRICLDLEWNPDSGELELIGLGNRASCVQIDWLSMGREMREATRLDVMAVLKRRHVVIHNADSDIRKLRANGFPISGPENFLRLDDPMLAHAVLHSEDEHTLEYLSLIHGILPPHKHLQWVIGAASVYNAGDLVQTVAVWDALDRELTADPQARLIYEAMSLPFLWLAIESEEAGIRIAPGVPERLF